VVNIETNPCNEVFFQAYKRHVRLLQSKIPFLTIHTPKSFKEIEGWNQREEESETERDKVDEVLKLEESTPTPNSSNIFFSVCIVRLLMYS
jgi:hypothetical protein